jgi:hypothetical protein
MYLNRWLSVILMMGFILVLNPLGAQADPYPHFKHHPKYHHPHGKAYGWHGSKHHGFDRPYKKHFRHAGMGPHHPRQYGHYAGPPVAYVTPVAPMVGIPYQQPQPYSQPPIPGLSGNVNWNF